MKQLTYQPFHPEDGVVNTADVYDYSLATMYSRYRNGVPDGFVWDRVEIIRMLCYVEIISYIKFNTCVTNPFSSIFEEINTNANQFRNNEINCL